MRFLKRLFGKGRSSAPTSPDAASVLASLFGGHGIAVAQHDGWLLSHGELPAMRLIWHDAPGQHPGRLDVQILLPDQRVIVESFAGIGEGATKPQDALQSFVVNSFHVRLAGLWQVDCQGQVDIAQWAVAGASWDVYHSWGIRASDQPLPTVPTDLLPCLQAAVESEALECDTHWFRVFAGGVRLIETFEALCDNEPWPRGTADRCLARA